VRKKIKRTKKTKFRYKKGLFILLPIIVLFILIVQKGLQTQILGDSTSDKGKSPDSTYKVEKDKSSQKEINKDSLYISTPPPSPLPQAPSFGNFFSAPPPLPSLLPSPGESLPTPAENPRSPTPYVSQGSSAETVIVPSQTTMSTNKLEVKTEDNRSKVNINEKGTEIRIIQVNGEVSITAKKSDGTQVKLDNQDFINAQDLLGPPPAENLPDVNQVSDNTYTLKFNNTLAETNIPLSLLVGKKVKALTNDGEKNIDVLPDEALSNLIDKKIITGTREVAPTIDQNGKIKGLSRKVKLVVSDHKLAYQISGVKKANMLGFIPVTIKKDILYSEEGNKTLRIDQSLGDKFTEFLSN